MKNNKFLLVIVLMSMSFVGFGQAEKDYVFKVLANKGSSEVKSGTAWSAVKTGSSLKKEDEIKVPENAYLGLVHSTGKPVEVKVAGTYKIADLASKVSGGTSVLNKYTDFILSSNSAEAKKNRLSATGAVHRGGNEVLDVFLPSENQFATIFNNTMTVRWESKVSGPYVVIFKNMFDDELMKVETPSNSLEVNLNDSKLANESAILIRVNPKSDEKAESKEYLVKRMSAAENDKIKKSLAEISSDVKDDSALDYLLLSGFYEQHGLIIDALESYEKAIKLAPDVPTFKEGYDDFLDRTALKDRPLKK